MRRDALQRAIKRIGQYRSKWFFKRCYSCDDDIKDEILWKFRHYMHGPTPVSYMVYTCMECAPNIADLIELKKHSFGKVDVTPLRKEMAEMEQHNKDGKKPPFDTDPQNRQSI